jgi:hypothetical protein
MTGSIFVRLTRGVQGLGTCPLTYAKRLEYGGGVVGCGKCPRLSVWSTGNGVGGCGWTGDLHVIQHVRLSSESKIVRRLMYAEARRLMGMMRIG